jgi:hypothetical protein
MAKKKKKSRLKKLLKGAALAGAAVLGAKALGRRNQMKDYLKTEGGDKSDMRDYGPFSKGANYVPGPSKYVRSKTVLGKPGINRMDTSEVDLDYTAPSTAQYKNMDMGLEGYYKKGGRVGCGVAKKGFGKAMKKGGKK